MIKEAIITHSTYIFFTRKTQCSPNPLLYLGTKKTGIRGLSWLFPVTLELQFETTISGHPFYYVENSISSQFFAGFQG